MSLWNHTSPIPNRINCLPWLCAVTSTPYHECTQFVDSVKPNPKMVCPWFNTGPTPWSYHSPNQRVGGWLLFLTPWSTKIDETTAIRRRHTKNLIFTAADVPDVACVSAVAYVPVVAGDPAFCPFFSYCTKKYKHFRQSGYRTSIEIIVYRAIDITKFYYRTKESNHPKPKLLSWMPSSVTFNLFHKFNSYNDVKVVYEYWVWINI